MHSRLIFLLALALGIWSAAALCAQENAPPEVETEAAGVTPPRLSFVDGQVSFFRPGADDWVRAQVNTPLSPGDQLYTGSPGNLELQIGSRAFVRGWANTQIGLENHDPDFIQFKVAAGHAAFDLRALDPGLTVEVATPNAAFTIDRPGYYRVDVGGERTAFIARRGGRAVATPEDGAAFSIAPSEEVVIEGGDSPQVSSFSAPPLDSWDNWNFARSDRLLEAESARYVPPGIYGASDLDRHGRWRVVPDYGPVWVPTGVPAGWAPYSTGAWVHDPYYGWTWVDAAPWGWAPYHHGRWVHVGGYWSWAPGPMVVRPVYAPALVAFFGDPHVQVGIGIGAPTVGWVALSWGEPCVPWWGRPGFIHRPWWGGWGGPRIVNNVVVHRTTIVNVEDIRVYRNSGVRHGVVAVPRDRFGHGHVAPDRAARVQAEDLRPMHKGPEVRPTPAAFAPGERRGIRPAEKYLKRPVVVTRPPHASADRDDRGGRKPEVATVKSPAPRVVPAPQPPKNTDPLPRPPFGRSSVERRPEVGRGQPPAPPKAEGSRRIEPHREAMPPSSAQLEQKAGQPQRLPRPEAPEKTRRMDQPGIRPSPAPAPLPSRVEPPRPAQRKLPGEPASRISPNRVEAAPRPHLESAGKPMQRPEPREGPERPRPYQPAPEAPAKGKRPGPASLAPGAAK